MISQSEFSFGARLKNGFDLLSVIETYPVYSPPKPEDSIDEFKNFLNKIKTTNEDETSIETEFHTVVGKRVDIFKTGENSVIKLLAMINGTVEANYAKESHQYVQISSLVRKLRNDTKKSSSDNIDFNVKSISTSERSYGSMAQQFSDIVVTLSNFGGYVTSNNLLTIDSLKTLADSLFDINKNVTDASVKLTDIRNLRRSLYEELVERVQRIKGYTKSQYGVDSEEFEKIKGISV